MSSVKLHQRASHKRQKAQRPSLQVLSFRRLALATVGVGFLVVGLWSYFHASSFISHVTYRFEEMMASLGFKLEDVVVQGRIRTNKDHILKTLALEKGKPLLSINLSDAKKKLEEITWVHAVSVERRFPDTLYIRISEKCPIALWLNHSKTFLLDKDGTVIETKEPHKYKELLIVTGEDVPDHVGDFITLLNKYPQIKSRTTGATHLRARRWDIKLDGKIDVKLPEKEVERALAYLMELEKDHHLMEKEIVTIDMRLPEQLILRLTPEAAQKKFSKGNDA